MATPDNESVLVTMAQSATGAQLEEVVCGYRRSRAAEEARAAQSLFEPRSVRWHYDDDGMLRLSARLPAEEGAQIVAALRAYEQTGTAASSAGSGTSSAGGGEDGSGDGAITGPTSPGPGVSAEAADTGPPRPAQASPRLAAPLAPA